MALHMPVRPPSRRDRIVPVPAARTALLLIDVINDLAFPGAAPLIARAEAMAPRVAALKKQAQQARVPVVYVNDNFGQWRSDFRQTVAHCTSRRSPGRVLSSRLVPTARDYFVLKPKHSGFYDTTLDTLLRDLKIRRVVLAGVAGNICVLFTANDAYMRDFHLVVPEDCVASEAPDDNHRAVALMRSVLRADTTPSADLDLAELRGRNAAASARGPWEPALRQS